MDLATETWFLIYSCYAMDTSSAAVQQPLLSRPLKKHHVNTPTLWIVLNQKEAKNIRYFGLFYIGPFCFQNGPMCTLLERDRIDNFMRMKVMITINITLLEIVTEIEKWQI